LLYVTQAQASGERGQSPPRLFWACILLAFVLWYVTPSTLLSAVAFVWAPLTFGRVHHKNLFLRLSQPLVAIFYMGNQFLMVYRSFLSPSRPCRNIAWFMQTQSLSPTLVVCCSFSHRFERKSLAALYSADSERTGLRLYPRPLHGDPRSHRQPGAHPYSPHLRPFGRPY
jgi:hypothetical protein